MTYPITIVDNFFEDPDEVVKLTKDIKWYKPDIMVIGSDWKGKKVIGEMFTDKLIFFDRVGDYSTTKMLELK